MQDWKIGKRAIGVESNPSINNAAFSVLVLPSQKRIALVISPPESGFITISMKNVPVAGDGIRLASGHAPLLLNMKDHGNIVQQPLQAIHSAATQTITVWETFVSEDELWRELD
jgi:hypothetical protein